MQKLMHSRSRLFIEAHMQNKERERLCFLGLLGKSF